MNAPALQHPSQRNLAGRRLGRYEVLTQLASGGMAGVYVARAQGVAGFERLVAIKVLHPHLAYEQEFITMFLDEARLAARIRHPNVVATLDVSDTEGDGYFIVMDYVEGDHLGALLQTAAKAHERLPLDASARILVDALSGLAAAHQLTDEHGEPLMLVHRDVSPHNILVGIDGIARLTDFGVAKAEVRLSSTREGQFKGKLAYMAPEHASSGEADQRSDLFSMGIILWESITGRRLFRGQNNADTLHRILEDPIPPPSSLVREAAPFDPVIERALARPPEQRFGSAEEFAEAVERAAAQATGLAGARAVAMVTRSYAAEKLAEEAHRVREAIDTLGRSELGEARMPLPREGSSSQVSRREPGSADAEADTVAARPATMAGDPDATTGAGRPGRARRHRWGAWALVVLAVAAAAATWAFISRGGAGPEVRPAAPRSPSPPATVAPDDRRILRDDNPGPHADPAPAEPRAPEEPGAEPEADRAATAGDGPEAAPRPTARPAARPATRRRRGRPTPDDSSADPRDDLLVNPYRQ